MSTQAVAAKAAVEKSLLQAHGLAKAFGGVRAVADVDFAIQSGEMRWLLGPNGAGKSTLFGLLSGLHRPDAGRIVFRSDDITHLPAYQRVRKGLCQKFQATRIFRSMSVAQNLLLATQPGPAVSNERLAWALAELRLDRESDTLAVHLSHTHQQWLEICLVLATHPALVLLDEPTAGMTPEETALTGRFIRALNATGVAILIVEHDMSFVRQVGGNVAVLHQGRVFREGSLDEIESDADVRRIYLGEA